MQELFLKKQKLIELSHGLQSLLLSPENTGFEKKHLLNIYKNEFHWLHNILYVPSQQEKK